MFNVTDRTGLEVGQWVWFFTSEDLSDLELEKQAIYEKNQRYLVISREDVAFDSCRCNVVDIDGKIYDYCARLFYLGNNDLDGVEIRLVSKKSVEQIHGVEKVQSVYQAAKEHIKGLSGYFSDYPAQILGKTSQRANETRKLNEILGERAFQTDDLTSVLALSMAYSNKKD